MGEDTKQEKTLDDYPVITERVVHHGLFWHYVPEVHVVNGEEKLQLVQHTAFNGEKVKLYVHSDLERGEKYGALLPEGQEALPEGVVQTAEEDEVELEDLDHEELVEWLMGVGVFDGEKKPNASEVIVAAKGNPELAERLIAAEKEASGDDPRETVVKGLEKIAAEGDGD